MIANSVCVRDEHFDEVGVRLVSRFLVVESLIYCADGDVEIDQLVDYQADSLVGSMREPSTDFGEQASPEPGLPSCRWPDRRYLRLQMLELGSTDPICGDRILLTVLSSGQGNYILDDERCFGSSVAQSDTSRDRPMTMSA